MNYSITKNEKYFYEMFNDIYIACFEFGEIYYVLETMYCVNIIIEDDSEDLFYCEIYLN